MGPDSGRQQVRARRAVVLACGGFTYSEALKREYLPAGAVGALGSPGNTGDGLRMAHKVGAGLWHLGEEASTLGILVDGFDAGFAVNLPDRGLSTSTGRATGSSTRCGWKLTRPAG